MQAPAPASPLAVHRGAALSAALVLPWHRRFLLISDSGIPVYNPLTFYQQLMWDRRSHLATCHPATPPSSFWSKNDTVRRSEAQLGSIGAWPAGLAA